MTRIIRTFLHKHKGQVKSKRNEHVKNIRTVIHDSDPHRMHPDARNAIQSDKQTLVSVPLVFTFEDDLHQPDELVSSDMTYALPLTAPRINRERGILILKWAASIVQILGYSATAFGMTPLNIYLFLIGLVGWFTVGLLWRDKAIMLIHVVALAAMIAGLISS